MSNKENSNRKLVVLGAGNYNFDTIIRREYPEGFEKGKRNPFVDKVVMEEIGSNPGNVMCILGYFGWDSYPIALLDQYPQGYQMKKDFERYHCNTRFVTNTPEGGTTCFSVTHLLDKDTGEPIIKRSRRHAPFSGFPRDKSLILKESLPEFEKNLDFLPDVYFFEGATAGWRELGKYLHEKGVLVYYEVQSGRGVKFNAFMNCMKQSDIIKFSDETFPNTDFVDQLKDKLVIQTLGSKGARFNLCGQGWVTLKPAKAEKKVDTEGCGDWTTASFINALGKRGKLKMKDITAEVVKECLEEAQGYAARNLAYMGTKGIIAADKDFHLEPSDYQENLKKLLEQYDDKGNKKQLSK